MSRIRQPPDQVRAENVNSAGESDGMDRREYPVRFQVGNASVFRPCAGLIWRAAIA